MITERPKDFEHWRAIARELLASQVSPREVRWLEAEDPQGDLFVADDRAGVADSSVSLPAPRLPRLAAPHVSKPRLIVPREFIELASLVACHRDPTRWDLLYRALWLITHGEPRLLRRSADEPAARLLAMDNAVRRDIRRTKTVVHFRSLTIDGRQRHLAWHRPEHRVLSLVAPFFRRRFRALNWTLMTPDGCVSWDGATLRRGPGIHCPGIHGSGIHGPGIHSGAAGPTDDELVELWRCAQAACLTSPEILS